MLSLRLKILAKFAFIGDLHSQLVPMMRAVDYCVANDLLPIFLGDLFDSRCEISESVAVYKFARKCQDELGAIVLDSNHQEKLCRYLKKGKVRLDLVPELARSISEFASSDVPAQELTQWLSNCPLGTVIRDDQGKEFRAAHAYFSSRIVVPDYDNLYLLTECDKRERTLCQYGPVNTKGDRRVWWKESQKRNWVRVSGHYHVIYKDEKSLLIDGGLGGVTRSWFCKEEPILVLYDSTSGNLVEFPKM